MTLVRRLSLNVLSLSLALSALISLNGCEVYDGDLPAVDELQTPVALAVHPSGRYLYVLNANFSGLYRDDLGGSLSVVDLETLQIQEDSTRCLPSFGTDMAFSATHYAEDEPRFIFATTKSNKGGVVFELNEQGDALRCLNKGEDVGPTCVNNIRDIPGVTRKKRQLPCEIRNVVNEPSIVTAIPSLEAVTPMEQDAFAIVGQSSGEIRAINLINGEIRGPESNGEQDRALHITARDFHVSPGAVAAATHPITGDTYYASRSDNRLFATRWAREAASSYDENPRQGFVAHIARMGLATIPASSNYQELRDATFSSDGSRLYVVSQNPSSLVTIDTSLNDDGKPRNVLVRRDIVAGRVGGIALVERPDATLAYLTLFDDRAIAVIDTQTGARVATIDVGAAPYAITPDPVRSRIYVALFEEDSVVVIDTDPASPSFHRQIATIR